MSVDQSSSFRDVLITANKVAAVTGGASLCYGYTRGLFANDRPVVRGVAGLCIGGSCGLSYWISRHYMLTWLNRHSPAGIDNVTGFEKVAASFTAGSMSRLVVGTLWTGRVDVPRSLFIGGFAVVLQAAFDGGLISGEPQADVDKRGIMDRVLSSKWMPIKKLSDQEYHGMLQEKLIRIEAEISMIDEELAQLRSSEPT